MSPSTTPLSERPFDATRALRAPSSAAVTVWLKVSVSVPEPPVYVASRRVPSSRIARVGPTFGGPFTVTWALKTTCAVTTSPVSQVPFGPGSEVMEALVTRVAAVAGPSMSISMVSAMLLPCSVQIAPSSSISRKTKISFLRRLGTSSIVSAFFTMLWRLRNRRRSISIRVWLVSAIDSPDTGH